MVNIEINLKDLVEKLSNIENKGKKKISFRSNILDTDDETLDSTYNLAYIIKNEFYENRILLTSTLYNDRHNEYYDLVNGNNGIIESKHNIDNSIKGFVKMLKKNFLDKGIEKAYIVGNNSDLKHLEKYDKFNYFEIWEDGDESITLFFS